MKSTRGQLSPNLAAAILVLVSFLWGSSFVVIKGIIADIPAAPINLARFAIATLLFTPFIRLDRRMWRRALELSALLFIGFATQTIGLKYTTVNRSAFIVAMNVIFVPIIGAIFGKRIRPIVCAAAITALAGCGLLCGDGGKPNIGDLWSLGTAITWAAYIYRLEDIAPEFPALPLTMAQFVPIMLLCASGRRLPRAHFRVPLALPDLHRRRRHRDDHLAPGHRSARRPRPAGRGHFYIGTRLRRHPRLSHPRRNPHPARTLRRRPHHRRRHHLPAPTTKTGTQLVLN